MINTIIFSKDRACQLELLIRSMKAFVKQWQELQPMVLYSYSDQFFKRGYKKLMQIHPDITYFHEPERPDGFQKSVLKLMSVKNPYTVFFVDDLVFRRKWDLNDEIFQIFSLDDRILCLSLRLSPRITFSYSMQRKSPPPAFEPDWIWNWLGVPSGMDWGYPFSLDGHIYRTMDIRRAMTTTVYSNPNQLEENLALQARVNAAFLQRPKIICYDDSKIVNIPANIVQKTHDNRHANFISVEEINQKWLDDHIIFLKNIIDVPNTAVHQEIPFKFVYQLRSSKTGPVSTMKQNIMLPRNNWSKTDDYLQSLSEDMVKKKKYPWHTVCQKKIPDHLPLVSVIIPCYNYGAFIEQTIDSVLHQTIQDFEIIVVDDGSNDPETVRKLQHLRKSKTTVLHQENQKLPRARNNGIKQTQGKYICCLDADDLLYPTYLEKCLAKLESENLDVCYSWLQSFGDHQRGWKTEEFDIEILIRRNCVPVAAIFKREMWQKVGGYNEKMIEGYEDWDFWISIAKAGGRGGKIDEYLFLYRIHRGSMINKSLMLDGALCETIKQNHLDLYINNPLRRKIKAETKKFVVQKPYLNMLRTSGRVKNTPSTNILFCLPSLFHRAMDISIKDIISGIKKENFNAVIVTSQKCDHEAATTNQAQERVREIFQLPHLFYHHSMWLDFVFYLIQTRHIKVIHIVGCKYIYSVLPKIKKQFPTIKIIDFHLNERDYISSAKTYARYLDQHIAANYLVKKALLRDKSIRQEKVMSLFNASDDLAAMLSRYIQLIKGLERDDFNQKNSLREPQKISRPACPPLTSPEVTTQGSHTDSKKMKKIALLTLATNKYVDFVPQFVKSCRKYFLKNHRVDIFVHSNKLEKLPQDCKKIFQEHLPWPLITLMRYNIFLKNRAAYEDYDYYYYCDVDMKFVGSVGEEIFGDIVATSHPGFFFKKREAYSYENKNRNSQAYIPSNEGESYFCGGFNGGKKYLELAEKISLMVDQDQEKNIIPVWNDESYLNRYLIDHKPDTILSPSYCYPEPPTDREIGVEGFIPKIMALNKNHQEFQRTTDEISRTAAGLHRRASPERLRNTMKIIIPTYNSEKYIKRCLHSIIQQSYSNWEAIVINDASTDSTYDVINEIKDDRLLKLHNANNKKALYNIVKGINLISNDEEDIIIIIDGDDWLPENDDWTTLEYINQTYQNQDIWLATGRFIHHPKGGYWRLQKPYDDQTHHQRDYRESEIRNSHIRTFRRFLFDQIDDEDLRSKDSTEYYPILYDLAIDFPMLEMCGKKHIKFMDRINYIYNIETSLNDNKV
ncbi:glycosyltransferase, partial [candidate division CSSED10-310 bacterium]